MGSKTFGAVTFRVYPNDHQPRHVHGFYSGIEVIVDLLGETTVVSNRRKAIKPGTAKLSDVKHILKVAAEHCDELKALWEEHHD